MTPSALCPKRMTNGPCGGVRPSGACEVDKALRCPYLDALESLPWRHPVVERSEKRLGKGRLEQTLCSGGFAVIAEVYTPDSADLTDLVRAYSAFKDKVTALNIAEHALATPHASTLAAAALLEREGLEAIINLTCRDRNRIGLQGEILGAAALGIKNLFCVTGDHPKLGDHPEAKAVFDLDSLQLVELCKTLRDKGELMNGRRLEHAPDLFIGAAANPFSPPVDLQAERVAAKVAAGADFIQTQAIFDVAGFESFAGQLGDLGALEHAYLIAGVALVTSLEQARWLQKEVPGARVPDAFVESLRKTAPAERRAFGLQYALELIGRLHALNGVSGVLLFPLHGDTSSLTETLDAFRS